MNEDGARADAGRRRSVLESALLTFARNGYRATSMDAVARDARISRPGLYFLFASKQALFRESAAHVLAQDLAAIQTTLAEADRPLPDRLLDAFDRWAGRYTGPLARDIPALIADNPDLLDQTARSAPGRFEELITGAIAEHSERAHRIAQTLDSVSVGLKHQVDSREAYMARMTIAIALLT